MLIAVRTAPVVESVVFREMEFDVPHNRIPCREGGLLVVHPDDGYYKAVM
jgi:hypothetical protein